jgi:6-pyruvoyltetrahydropterin/6-carboxytetrahydropterin synthase
MFELKILTSFAAAHQLTMVAKQCENLHGHNWKVEVCVSGEDLNEAGVIIDFGELKSYVAEIIKEMDHKFLNELPYFDNAPSSEKIAVHIARRLEEKLQGSNIRVSRVTTWESENAAATYIPES